MVREEDERAWLREFILREWGRGLSNRDVMRLSSLCRRCEKLALKEDDIRSAHFVGRGRGQAGFRCGQTLFPHRKRLRGGGKKTKCPELGFELFQWLVDTVDNLKCRVKGWMLTQQALLIQADIEKYSEENDLAVETPTIEGSGWVSRWRREWGISVRAVTVVYKVSWADLITRIGIGLRNNIRLRTLWRCFFGTRPFKVVTCDQKPFWFNSNGCDATLSFRGSSGVQVVENHCATRERFTMETTVRSWAEEDRPLTAVLFKHGGIGRNAGKQIRERVIPKARCYVRTYVRTYVLGSTYVVVVVVVVLM